MCLFAYDAHQKFRNSALTESFWCSSHWPIANMSSSAGDYFQQNATVNSDSYHYLSVTPPEAKREQWFSINLNSSPRLHYGFIGFDWTVSKSLALLSFTLSAFLQHSISVCYLDLQQMWKKRDRLYAIIGIRSLGENFLCNRWMKQKHNVTQTAGLLSLFPSVFGPWAWISLPSSPSDRECTVWAKLGFLTLVKELFLARHSEKDKSLAQIPN